MSQESLQGQEVGRARTRARRFARWHGITGERRDELVLVVSELGAKKEADAVPAEVKQNAKGVVRKTVEGWRSRSRIGNGNNGGNGGGGD